MRQRRIGLSHQGGQQCDDHTHSHHHLHGAAGSQGETLSILVGDGFHNFTDGLLDRRGLPRRPGAGLGHHAGHHRPRSAAGGRRLRHPARRRLGTRPGTVLERRVQPDRGSRRHHRLLRLDHARDWIPYIITIAAASFLYIAIADLMPRLKRETQVNRLARPAARRRHRRRGVRQRRAFALTATRRRTMHPQVLLALLAALALARPGTSTPMAKAGSRSSSTRTASPSTWSCRSMWRSASSARRRTIRKRPRSPPRRKPQGCRRCSCRPGCRLHAPACPLRSVPVNHAQAHEGEPCRHRRELCFSLRQPRRT
jgi:hypothetical protein